MKKLLLILLCVPLIGLSNKQDTIHYKIGIVDIYYIFSMEPDDESCDFYNLRMILSYPPYEMGSCSNDIIFDMNFDFTGWSGQYAYIVKEVYSPFTNYIGFADGYPYKNWTDRNLKEKNINKVFEDVLTPLMDLNSLCTNVEDIPKKDELKTTSYFNEKNETLVLLFGGAGMTGWGRSFLILIDTTSKDVERRYVSIPFCGE